MRIVVPVLACLLSWTGAAAATTESSRARTTLTVDRNVIRVDQSVKYAEYAVGEWLRVTLEYGGTCNIVFKSLALRRSAPFTPSGAVTGEIDNVSGTPEAGRPAKTGRATFDVHFNTLSETATGARSGVARVDLVLGVDKDCNLLTGDADGVDRSATIRVEIGVSTDPKSDD